MLLVINRNTWALHIFCNSRGLLAWYKKKGFDLGIGCEGLLRVLYKFVNSPVKRVQTKAFFRLNYELVFCIARIL